MKTLDKESDDIKMLLYKKIQQLKQEKSSKEKEIYELEKHAIQDVWDELPVGPLEFCRSSEFLGDKEGTKIFPSIVHDLEVIFSGTDKYGNLDYSPACNLHLDISGLSSGKSTKISIIMSYMTYWLHCLKNPTEYFGLWDHTSTILFMCVAPTEEKAKQIVYDKTCGLIKSIPWFKDRNYLPDPRNKNQLRFYKIGVDPITLHPKDLKNHKPVLNIRYAAGKGNAAVGEDLMLGVVDECCTPGCFELKNGTDIAEDIYETMHTRRDSRFKMGGMTMYISSAGTDGRWLEQKMQAVEEHRKRYGILSNDQIVPLDVKTNVYAVRRPTWEANPKHMSSEKFPYKIEKTTDKGVTLSYNLEIPTEYRSLVEQNPEKFLRDVAAVPTSAYQPFFTNWSRVLEKVNKNRVDPLPDNGKDNVLHPFTNEETGQIGAWDLLPPDFVGKSGVQTYLHVDLGTGGVKGSGTDACGLCVSHRGPDVEREGVMHPTVVIDLCIRFKASKKKIQKMDRDVSERRVDEIQVQDVREFIIRLARDRGFDFAKITFDNFASLETIQVLNRMGFEAEKASCTKDTWDNCRTMWYDGRIDIFEDTWLLYEMSKLEDKGSYVEHSSNSSDDEAQAMARAVELAVEGFIPDRPKARPRPRLGPGLLGGGGGVGTSRFMSSNKILPRNIVQLPFSFK